MESLNCEKSEEKIRKRVICKFAEMFIDMDYLLCVPLVHAKYQSEEMIVGVNGDIRKKSSNFPEDKAILLVKWVNLHKEEIVVNHRRINHNEIPFMIDPLQ